MKKSLVLFSFCCFPTLITTDYIFGFLCCMIKEAQTYAEDTGLLFMETSAKTAMNVNELFLAIGERLIVLISTSSICFL